MGGGGTTTRRETGPLWELPPFWPALTVGHCTDNAEEVSGHLPTRLEEMQPSIELTVVREVKLLGRWLETEEQRVVAGSQAHICYSSGSGVPGEEGANVVSGCQEEESEKE